MLLASDALIQQSAFSFTGSNIFTLRLSSFPTIRMLCLSAVAERRIHRIGSDGSRSGSHSLKGCHTFTSFYFISCTSTSAKVEKYACTTAKLQTAQSSLPRAKRVFSDFSVGGFLCLIPGRYTVWSQDGTRYTVLKQKTHIGSTHTCANMWELWLLNVVYLSCILYKCTTAAKISRPLQGNLLVDFIALIVACIIGATSSLDKI